MLGREELVEAVRRSVPELSHRQAAEVLEALIKVMIGVLAKGQDVSIPGFGTFSVRQRIVRTGRDAARDEGLGFPGERSVLFRSASERRSILEYAGAIRGDAPSGERPPIHAGALQLHAVVEVFYATDRRPVQAGGVTRWYGPERGIGDLSYGVCKVSIPHDHRMGKLEGPSILRFEVRQDPEKHVVVMSVQEEDADTFFSALGSSVGSSAGKQAVVFVHGFSVTFEDAVRRTAQIAYDLQFDGAAICYSWPSRGKMGLLPYTTDEDSVQWTVPHLIGLLERLAGTSAVESIQLIAHSMGNRALTDALKEIGTAMAQDERPRFGEVILTAPDINADVFRRLMRAIRPAARHLTLYASANDKALRASHRIHGYPRAGDVGTDIVVLSEIDTIDASAVDTGLIGHSYYGDNRSVLSDIFYLLGGTPADRRAGLRRRQAESGGMYWVFVP